MLNQEKMKLSEVSDKPDYVFIDNLTLFHSEQYFNEVPTLSKIYTNEFIMELARHPQNSAFLGLIEALVLCDRCLVDHFTLLASDTCQRVLALLRDVISPVYIPETDRLAVYNDLLNMELKERAKFALKEEWNLLSRIYYHTPATNSTQMIRYTGFTDQYYDPSDRHKQQAISKGMYNPLNLGRTCFYMLLARQTGLPYLPHPWREGLLSAISGVRKPVSIDIVKFMTEKIAVSVRDEVRSIIPNIESSVAPPIASDVLRRAKEPKYVIEALLEMRESKRARRFRKWSREFREAICAGAFGTLEAQRMWKTVEDAAQKWKNDLDEEVRYRTRTLKLGFGPAGIKAEIPSFTIKDPIIISAKRYRPLLFLNDLFRPSKYNQSI